MEHDVIGWLLRSKRMKESTIEHSHALGADGECQKRHYFYIEGVHYFFSNIKIIITPLFRADFGF